MDTGAWKLTYMLCFLSSCRKQSRGLDTVFPAQAEDRRLSLHVAALGPHPQLLLQASEDMG